MMADAESPVVVLALFQPRAGHLERVLDAMRVAIPRVHEERGCDLYCIQLQDNDRIVMVERWASVDDLDAHAAGVPVADFNASLEGLLEAPPEVTRLVPVPIGDPVRGAIPPAKDSE